MGNAEYHSQTVTTLPGVTAGYRYSGYSRLQIQ